MDTKGLQNEFIAWCKKNNHSPKSEDETKKLFTTFMKEKHPKEYEAAMKKQQQSQEQVKAAAHGAKLSYFKNLKNQCAEDEEVVYYKKGGSVKCGCKKKEQGGEVPVTKNGCSAVEKFKKARKAESGSKMLDLVDSRKGRQQAQAEAKKKREAEAKKKGTYAENTIVIGKDIQRGQKDAGPKAKVQDSAVPNEDIPSYDKKQQKPVKESSRKVLSPAMKRGGDVKKVCGGSVVAKFKAAKCGSKLKKHLQGGKLVFKF